MDPNEHDLRSASPPGLPPELDRFGPRLERAVTRDLARSSQRRRVLTGVGVAALAAVAVFAGIAAFGTPGSHGPGGVDSAGAVDKAAAALAKPEGVIVHLHIVGTQTTSANEVNAAGVVRWEDESWQLTSAPYTRRQIEKGPGTPKTETGVVDGRNALYDAAADTIYAGGEPYTDVGQSSEADGFREKALEGLKSGEARVAGHETVDGRDAIKIVVSADEEYLVDAQTYDPIEWRTRGTSETATLRFVAYEKLPLTAESKALLDLRAQHPDATVDTDPGHYQQAMSDLFPKG